VQYSDSVQWNGDKITRGMGVGIAAGLNAAAHRLRAETIPRTPLDQGPLRENFVVHEATANTSESAVSNDLIYAPIQHEREDFNHSVGEAKFLENALNASRAELLGLIAAGVRRGMFS
jgi:hypothetical protein